MFNTPMVLYLHSFIYPLIFSIIFNLYNFPSPTRLCHYLHFMLCSFVSSNVLFVSISLLSFLFLSVYSFCVSILGRSVSYLSWNFLHILPNMFISSTVHLCPSKDTNHQVLIASNVFCRFNMILSISRAPSNKGPLIFCHFLLHNFIHFYYPHVLIARIFYQLHN